VLALMRWSGGAAWCRGCVVMNVDQDGDYDGGVGDEERSLEMKMDLWVFPW